MSSASLSLKRRRLPPAGCCVARGPVICSLCCRCHSRPNSGSGLVGGASRFDHDWGVQTWPTMHCDDHCAIDRGRRGRAAREGKADEEIFKNRLLRSSATFLPAGRAWSSAYMVEYGRVPARVLVGQPGKKYGVWPDGGFNYGKSTLARLSTCSPAQPSMLTCTR